METLTVVAPLSLGSWYSQFAGLMTAVLFVGEGAQETKPLADKIEVEARGRSVRILSGHDSLLRDWVLANELRARGIEVASQSGMATSAGVDKILQKQILELAGVPIPAWGTQATDPPAELPTLWKGRTSTQSRDLAWRKPNQPPPRDAYWESYIDGTEFSVVLYRDAERTTIFPPVWKGNAQRDLSPPWRRLRLVPGGAERHLKEQMTSTAVCIAELLDAWGFIEVEFIVPATGPALVMDINPRVCGTMRIVAMATGVPIFDPSKLPNCSRDVLKILNFAAEIPYSGSPFTTPSVVASSRLTCAAQTSGEVKGMLAERDFDASEAIWPVEWHEN